MTKIFNIIAILFLLTSVNCSNLEVSKYNNQAVKIISKLEQSKKSDEFHAKPLTGGLSGAKIILVKGTSNKYVVRFVSYNDANDFDRELASLKLASEKGFGPKLYAFNKEKKYFVLEFIESSNINHFKENNENIAIELANLLKKIHSNQVDLKTISHFDEIYRDLNSVKEIPGLNKIKLLEIIKKIENSIGKYPHKSFTHKDFNPNNMLLKNGNFYAIDYQNSASDDPFIDIAAAGVFYGRTEKFENKLLNEYFGRKPSIKELAKYNLMKQVILAYYSIKFCKHIDEIPEENSLLPVDYNEIFQQIVYENKPYDLKDDRKKLSLAFSMIDQIFENHDNGNIDNLIKQIEN